MHSLEPRMYSCISHKMTMGGCIIKIRIANLLRSAGVLGTLLFTLSALSQHSDQTEHNKTPELGLCYENPAPGQLRCPKRETPKKQAVDPHSKFLVFTSSSGLKLYQFDKERRSYKGAQKKCEDEGLRLLNGDEAAALQKELETNKSQLQEWLAERKVSQTWFSPSSPEHPAGYFYASQLGRGIVEANEGHEKARITAVYTRCVRDSKN